MKRAGGINGASAHQGRQPRCEKPFMVKQHEATEHRNHCLLFLPLVPRLSFKSPHQAPTAERNTVTGAVLEINVFPPLFTYDWPIKSSFCVFDTARPSMCGLMFKPVCCWEGSYRWNTCSRLYSHSCSTCPQVGSVSLLPSCVRRCQMWLFLARRQPPNTRPSPKAE